jgi:lysophospholipase L1-like esterase
VGGVARGRILAAVLAALSGSIAPIAASASQAGATRLLPRWQATLTSCPTSIVATPRAGALTGCWSGASSSLSEVDGGGQELWSRSDAPHMAAAEPIVDAAGNWYRYQINTNSDAYVIVGGQGSAIRWQTPVSLANSCCGLPLQLGADGRLYIYTQNYQILAINRTTGAVEATFTLPRKAFGTQGAVIDESAFRSYLGGLVMENGGNALWVSYSGSLLASVAEPRPSSEPLLHCGAAACVAPDGTLFVTTPYVPDSDPHRFTIAKLSPAGVAWQYTRRVPAECDSTFARSTYFEPSALPDGGVAVYWENFGGDCPYNITTFNADGSPRWTASSGFADADATIYDNQQPIIDGSDRVVQVTDEVSSDASCTNDYYSVIATYDGTTGDLVGTAWAGVDAHDCPIGSYGSDVAISSGRMLAAGPITGVSGDGSDYLWAFDQSGLLGSYPDTTIRDAVAASSSSYAALGDSFASGEGSFSYLPGTDVKGNDTCHRATNGYAEQFAAKSGDVLSFAACSGATIADITSPNQEGQGEPAQIENVSGASLVTISIGINDVRFSEIMSDCVYDQFGVYGAPGCAERDSALFAGDLATVGNELPDVYDAIATAAPNAEIVIVGYPHLFGSFGGSSCHVGTFHHADRAYVSQSDAEWLNQAADQLDAKIRNAVKIARSYTGANLQYLNGQDAFFYHGLCDAEPSYFNGLVFSGLTYRAESFHPNVAGQNTFAQWLAKHA